MAASLFRMHSLLPALKAFHHALASIRPKHHGRPKDLRRFQSVGGGTAHKRRREEDKAGREAVITCATKLRTPQVLLGL
uniref:Uncharacterized protein n=1 Tax=Ixodes ricinus TaxID=34613 RepID=A0A147BLU8_IXORI